jgi:nickel-dependent lactate racemase
VKIDIPYGRERKLPLIIPERNLVGVVYPNAVKCGNDLDTILNALKTPIGGKSLDKFLNGARNILVVVNDATRPTPSAKMLGCIFKTLQDRNVKFISAVGSHRAPKEDEHREMFGDIYDEIKNSVIVHECKKEQDMVSFGKTQRGTEIRMNRAVAEADRIIIINSVEPHYFAGYTGGRKSIFPGLASYSSIEQNHKLALDGRAQTFALSGNPVHEDMEEIVSIIGKEIYSIQAVLDAHHRIYAAFAGDYKLTFDEAVKKANEVFAVEIKERADIVITVAPFPTDIDLYQAQKSLDNGKNAVKMGGVMILVAECRDSIGNETFYKLLSSARRPEDVFAEIEKGYRLGYHKAAKMAETFQNCSTWAVSSLSPSVLDKIFIRSFPDVQAALDAAIAKKGSGSSVLVLMDGNLTVPKVAGSE